MTDSVADTHRTLQARIEKLVKVQKSYSWTTPEHHKKLGKLLDSVTKIGVALKLSVKFSVSASGKDGATGSGKGGAKADALSLGVGVSAKTAAAVKAGISLGVGFSTALSTKAALNSNLHTGVAHASGLERALLTYNASAKASLGGNAVLAPGKHPDPKEIDSAISKLDSNLAQSQSQADSLAPATPKSPLTGEIRMTRVGAWHADFATDDESPLTGKVSFKIDELVFSGTVLPGKTGLDGSRARCHIVGGNGGLSTVIPGTSYTNAGGVKTSAVLRDILHACHEDLSDLSDGDILDLSLPRWHVSSGPASEALTDLANSVGASWRTLRDGSVWFGVELWPEVVPDHQVLDEDWSSGAVTMAPETPDMVPGVVYRGQRVEHVIHQLDEKLRTEVRTDHPRAALDRYMAGQRRGVDYSREWPCRVVTQNPDYTLQLLPDDEAMKAAGLDQVPIRYGMPGMRAKIKPGARCHLAFAAGDPKRPFAHNWEFDEDTVEFVDFVASGRASGMARIGDSVKVFVNPGVPIPVTGTVSGAPFVGIMTIATPLQAVIETGNPKFRA
jgi:hypothetical protein